MENARRNAAAWSLLEFIFLESLSANPAIRNSSDFAANAVASEIIHLLSDERNLEVFAEFSGIPAPEIVDYFTPFLESPPNPPVSSA